MKLWQWISNEPARNGWYRIHRLVVIGTWWSGPNRSVSLEGVDFGRFTHLPTPREKRYEKSSMIYFSFYAAAPTVG